MQTTLQIINKCILQYEYINNIRLKMKYTSLRVREDRKMALERAAIEISYAIGKQVKWTDVANYMFDDYLRDAVKDMKSKIKEKG